LDPSVGEVTGLYYADCAPAKPPAQALDSEAAKKLWTISEKLVQIGKQD